MVALSPPCESGAGSLATRKPAKPQERMLYMRSRFGTFRECFCALRERIVQEHTLRLPTLRLAARRPRERALRDDLHLPDADPDLLGDGFLDFDDELVGVARERFGANDELLFAGAVLDVVAVRVDRHPEGDDVAAPDAGELAHDPLDVVRVEVSPADDDD